MIAAANIEVHGKKFEIGQAVTGLSRTDEKWMREKGYLKDEPKEEPKKEIKRKTATGNDV